VLGRLEHVNPRRAQRSAVSVVAPDGGEDAVRIEEIERRIESTWDPPSNSPLGCSAKNTVTVTPARPSGRPFSATLELSIRHYFQQMPFKHLTADDNLCVPGDEDPLGWPN
jgi:hypothetical protein